MTQEHHHSLKARSAGLGVTVMGSCCYSITTQSAHEEASVQGDPFAEASRTT